jgi:hypothetical protein
MSIRIETPSIVTGQPEQQIRQILNYLFRLSENLNVALESIDSKSAGSSNLIVDADKMATQADTYNELRALIINTSEAVNAEIDTLQTQLNSSISAINSEWGTYQENIESIITATATGIVQSYNYDSQIQTLQEQAAGFSAYQIQTEGFIRQGFIDYDENNVPIIGIAIGKRLQSTTVVIDGEEIQQFDTTQNCAFYTSDKVSFRINGQEVAYVSNQKMYIRDASILGRLDIANKWRQEDTSGGFVIRWIGG